MAETNLTQRIAHCIEMANEITEENSRRYCLASVLAEKLDTGTTARGLAEVLEDRLSECEQMLRLVQCLEEVGAVVEERTADSQADQRIAGALECLAQIRIIEHAAENLPKEADAGAVWFGMQEKAGADLAAAFGQMTPRQEGALRALGEYIHNVHAAGTPYLEKWRPVVCRTPNELQSVVEEFDAA